MLFLLMGNEQRFTDLAEFVEVNGLKKNRVAARLGVTPQFFSSLLNPDVYRPRVDPDLAARIADLLNQPESYVRKFYEIAA